MALITVCGLPAVGKTTFAERLRARLGAEESKRSVTAALLLLVVCIICAVIVMFWDLCLGSELCL